MTSAGMRLRDAKVIGIVPATHRAHVTVKVNQGMSRPFGLRPEDSDQALVETMRETDCEPVVRAAECGW
jgi:hypothetical protein